MNCEHCEKEITGRAFVVRDRLVCGCCSCTLARRAPGFVGRNYEGQKNPDKYEPTKEQRMAIKWMANRPDSDPNHISDTEAARFARTFGAHNAAIERFDKENAYETAKVQEQSDHMQKVQEGEITDRLHKNMDVLRHIDAEIASGGIDNV